MDSIADYQRALNIQRKAREAAEHQLEEKSRELYEKNQSLQDAMRKLNEQQQQLIAQEKQVSIGQLSAGLAHEINNPNAFVISNLSVLKDYVASLTKGIQEVSNLLDSDKSGSSTSQQALKLLKDDYDFEFIKSDMDALLKETEQGAQRIKRIIQSMQYFSNQDPRQIKSFDLKQCIESSASLIEKEVGNSIRFEVSIEDMPLFSGVPPLISQAIVNILRNAAESHPKSATVTLSAEVDENEIVITIKDDGDGIEAEKLSKVFDPFFTTKPYVNGLGLTVSQAIIKQHDGYIKFDTEHGKYSVFTIHLPLPKV